MSFEKQVTREVASKIDQTIKMLCEFLQSNEVPHDIGTTAMMYLSARMCVINEPDDELTKDAFARMLDHERAGYNNETRN